MKRFCLTILFFLFLYSNNFGQVPQYSQMRVSMLDTINSNWVDSVFLSLTPEQRIAQLFMVSAYSTTDKRNNKGQIIDLIKKYGIGGLIFMQGTPDRQIQYINEYQSLSKVPLLIGMDLECGLGFRLDGTTSFPKNMTLGALKSDSLVYELGKEIARQCKLIGVQVNFAPDIDINNNKNNPVIGVRSFGESRDNVVKKGYALMRGMQDEKILAVGKHFPGHGDTNIDSHKKAPVLNFSRKRLDSLELYPFRKLIQQGIGGIMTAHLRANALDPNNTASLSKKITTDLLQNDMKFEGLIFTDALNMGGVAQYFAPGEIELSALNAGNDILLFPQDAPKAIETIIQATKKNPQLQEEIDRRVKKILKVKLWSGLNKVKRLEASRIYDKINSIETKILQEKIAKASITMVKNIKSIPLKSLENKKIACVAIGTSRINAFQKQLSRYSKVKNFIIPRNAHKSEYSKILNALKGYNTIIVSKHANTKKPSSKYGATQSSIDFINKLQAEKLIFAFFGYPYGVSHYNLSKLDAVLLGYNDSKYAQEAMAQAIFGGISISGRLPVSINKDYPLGWGIETKKNRLGYSMPENEGMNADTLSRITRIVEEGIKKKAMPGCQVLIAKNGNIIYNRAFGYHTYKKKTRVKDTDLYDLASLTKVSATLPILMQEYDRGTLKLSTRLDEIFPEYFKNTDKANITVEDMITHETGLPAWIPFYKLLIDPRSCPQKKLLRGRPSRTYNIKVGRRTWLNKNAKIKKGIFSSQGTITVGKNFKLRKSLLPTFMDTIKNAQRIPNRKYRYSDLGFIILGEYFKKNNNFLTRISQIYKEIGATSLCMTPYKNKPLKQIVPTAKDRIIRKKMLTGYVHDLNSALLGGVAGHAGLFGSAQDLAKLWAMYMQKGKYGGKSYIEPSTIQLFTSQAHPKISRRGYGFDKAEPDSRKKSSFIHDLPTSGFGHTGFTGTLVWADPENEILFIFLSNRVHPYDWNRNIYKANIRSRIQENIYNAIDKDISKKDFHQFIPIN